MPAEGKQPRDYVARDSEWGEVARQSIGNILVSFIGALGVAVLWAGYNILSLNNSVGNLGHDIEIADKDREEIRVDAGKTADQVRSLEFDFIRHSADTTKHGTP